MTLEYPSEQHTALLAQFDQLQQKLPRLWAYIGRSDPGGPVLQEPNTVVVLPSHTVGVKLDIASQQAYEERMLFMIFLLRQPHIRLVFLSSLPVAQDVVDYYLDILPSVTIHNARRRLFMVSPQDASERPLVTKLLDRPHLIAHIRSLIPDLDKAHLVPFMTTDLERDFAVRLGIPMYAADPRYTAFGTKSGCRRIFAEEGVSHPLGVENISSQEELVVAICAMRRQKPAIRRVVVKHNEGVSGYGNAQLDLTTLPAPGSPEEAGAVRASFSSLRYELPEIKLDWFMRELQKNGGIVEELITGEPLFSPSVQMRISPLGSVQVLSTHDQLLGGPSGQVYLGARFPANPAYGPLITREAQKIGERFAREGVVGRFAIDFIVVQDEAGGYHPYAIEVNLRKGGTTHPFLTLQYLTDGRYNPDTGLFYTARGQVKYYLATDSLKSPAYRQFTPSDLFDIVSHHRLHFDHTSQTGVVLHMMSAVGAAGRLGFTAIANSAEEAEAMYAEFGQILDREAV